MVVGGGGPLCISTKRIDVRREHCFGGFKTKVRGTFGNLNVPPHGFCPVWLNTCLSLEMSMQQSTLTTMGCSGIILHLYYRYCSWFDHGCIQTFLYTVRVE